MRLPQILLTLTSLVSIAVAQELWDPEKVTIVESNITYTGNGCPPHPLGRPTIYARWPTNANASFLQLGVAGGVFSAKVGPDVPIQEYYKRCDIVVPIEYQEGYRFEVTDLSVVGLHGVPDKHVGLVNSLIYFKDYVEEGGTTSAGETIWGPFENPNGAGRSMGGFDKTPATSPCGGDVKGTTKNWGALVIDTDLILASNEKPQVTIAEFKIMAQFLTLKWHACTPNDGAGLG